MLAMRCLLLFRVGALCVAYSNQFLQYPLKQQSSRTPPYKETFSRCWRLAGDRSETLRSAEEQAASCLLLLVLLTEDTIRRMALCC
jgi:hypothetical protein